MKSTYVLTVETNLTKQGQHATDVKVYKRDIKVFEDFKSAKIGMRSVIKEFATTKNEIFDGNGSVIGFDEEYFDIFRVNDFEINDDSSGWSDISLKFTGEFCLPIKIYHTFAPPFMHINTFDMSDPDKTYVIRISSACGEWGQSSFIYLELRKVNVE